MTSKIKLTGWSLLFAFFSISSQAQNSAIFKGGVNDGWNRSAAVQSGNSIYKGGTGDGWHSQMYSQVYVSAFKGGIGDGWNIGNYASQYTDTRIGGIGDGWAPANYNSVYGEIRKGGVGDGWASTYQPAGPLPVEFISFEASKTNNNTDALLEWKVASEINADRYDVERSSDAVSFSKIGQVKAVGDTKQETSYQFTDIHPMTGHNYYRLKQLDIDGRYKYTPVRVLEFHDNTEHLTVYPNPGNGLFTLALNSDLLHTEAAINVIGMNGAVVFHVKLIDYALPTKELDLTHLASGNYMIHIHTLARNFGVKVTIVK